MTKGFVYIIKEEDGSPLYKIGKAKDIDSRIGSMQTGNPRRLLVIAQELVPDNHAMEQGLHRKFESKRKEGEWFALNAKELKEAIKMLNENTLYKEEDAELLFRIINGSLGKKKDMTPHIGTSTDKKVLPTLKQEFLSNSDKSSLDLSLNYEDLPYAPRNINSKRKGKTDVYKIHFFSKTDQNDLAKQIVKIHYDFRYRYKETKRESFVHNYLQEHDCTLADLVRNIEAMD